jgi:DNA-binding CsgD family transcriptional regulator
MPFASFEHTPLIGRDGYLSRLRAALLPPYADPMVIVLEGPAGIGKTSLLRAGIALAEAADATVMYARPVEAEATFAYATLSDLLGPWLEAVQPRLPAAHRDALQVALDVGDPVGVDDDRPAPDPNAQRVAMAVLAACRALAGQGPLMIAVDDASWTDQASREALSFAFRRLADLPIRLLIAQRSDEPGHTLPFALGEAARPIQVERLWLEPLSMGALHDMVRTATGATFSRSTLSRIRELSGGNPFYALELARSVVAEGAQLRPGYDVPVPSSLRELVGSRLEHLPSSTRRLLLTAALSTRPTVGLLEAAAGGDPETALRPALDAGLIRIDGRSITFCHPLYASTLVAEASVAECRRAHAWLSGAMTEDPEARARHLALASDGPNARLARTLAQAGARARRRAAPGVAGALADMAVERTPPGSPDLPERALAAAEAWFVAGDLTAARDRVAALVPAVEGVTRARALLLMGIVTWYTGTAQQAAAVLLPALADARGDRALDGLLHYYLAIFRDDDLVVARRHAIAAAGLLEGTSDHGHLAAALLEAFHWTVALGRKPPMPMLTRGLEVEREGPLTDRLTSPGIWWAAIGRLDLARDRFQQLMDFDLLHGEYANAANLLTRLAEVELWADDWEAARRHALAAVETDIQTGGVASEMALRAVALVDAHEGRLAAAVDAADAGILRTKRAGTGVLAAAWLLVAALAAASQGDAARVTAVTEEASRHLRSAGYREPLRLDPAPERVEALAQVGRVDEAALELEGLEARHRRIAKPWAAAAIARGRARIALAQDDPESALAATSMVASTAPVGWSRFDRARTLLVRGEALRRSRSRRDAAEVLARAEDAFRELGAMVWADRAAAERARLGLARSAARALTPMEARVARLAGDGLSTRDVAAELGISPRTVETHLASIYGKLAVNSRAELGRAMAPHQID